MTQYTASRKNGKPAVAPSTRALKEAFSDPTTIVIALGLRDDIVGHPRSVDVRCPVHDEKNPSCSVFVGSDGTAHAFCHGCGWSGDVFDLVAAVNGLNPRGRDFSVVKSLVAELADTLPDNTGRLTESQPSVPDAAFAMVAEALLTAAPLTAQNDVCEYLAGRGILDEALADGWGALPADPGELALLERTMTERIGLGEWTAAGLADAAGRIVSRQHRVLIPWRAADGTLTTIQRRVVVRSDAKRKYLWPQRRGPCWPYGTDTVTQTAAPTDIAFVEGAVDTLSLRKMLRTHGYNWIVVGLPSANTWRAGWAELARGRQVHLALDSDSAGKRGAERIRDSLSMVGVENVTRATPRGACDWNELLAMEVGSA